MAQLKHSNKPLFTINVAANIRIIMFALASVVFMMMDHRTQQLDTVRDTLSTLVYPIQYAVQLPFDAVNRLYSNLAQHRELLNENERLRKKQLFINAQLQKLNSLEAENRRLRMLLESSGDIREQVLIAELVAVDSDPYRHQILINKGSRHGVHTGQPLIDQQGVAGQIVHANSFTSTAILITDPNHALPVQVDRNGLSTLAVGTGNLQQLELPHLPDNHDVKVGDLLITSGLGGRFPRGYPVAKITEVTFDPGHPFARIKAQPTAHLDRIREVLLVISEPLPEADSLSIGPYKQP